jgi:hypothetical protein
MTFQVEFATQPKVLNVEFDTALNISGGYDDGFNDGFSQGKSEGLTEGEAIGYGKGEAVGYENGYTEGDAKGYERGYGEGEANGMQEFVNNRGLAHLYESTPYPNYEFWPSVNEKTLSWLLNVDLSKVNDTQCMFKNLEFANKTKVPLFDTSAVLTMESMFENDSQNTNAFGNYVEVPNFDTRKVFNMNRMFYNRRLMNFPVLSYESVKTANNLFYNVRFFSATEVADMYFPKATELYSLFSSASNLTKVGNIVAPLANYAPSLFYYTRDIVSVGDITLKEGESFSFGSAFYNCNVLTSIGKLNFTPSSIQYAFRECNVLETIPSLDLRKCTSASDAFRGCKALKNLALKNIKTSLHVCSGTSWGHLLTLESLIGLCYELRDTGSSLTLTIGSANLAKLANVYVREIPITDAMREADDLIDEKLPFERCESTADGATLISDYVLLKNWKLA